MEQFAVIHGTMVVAANYFEAQRVHVIQVKPVIPICDGGRIHYYHHSANAVVGLLKFIIRVQTL